MKYDIIRNIPDSEAIPIMEKALLSYPEFSGKILYIATLSDIVRITLVEYVTPEICALYGVEDLIPTLSYFAEPPSIKVFRTITTEKLEPQYVKLLPPELINPTTPLEEYLRATIDSHMKLLARRVLARVKECEQFVLQELDRCSI